MERRSHIYGVMGEFATPEQLTHAVEKVREAGYRRLDAYAPFPVEGLSQALGLKRNLVPLIALFGGLAGGVGGFGFQYWVAAITYPMNVGGRPLNSWPAFIPVTFELTILGASLAAVFGMLALNRLPQPHHPVCNVHPFTHASSDRFFVCVEARDPRFQLEETSRVLQSLHAHHVNEVSLDYLLALPRRRMRRRFPDFRWRLRLPAAGHGQPAEEPAAFAFRILWRWPLGAAAGGKRCGARSDCRRRTLSSQGFEQFPADREPPASRARRRTLQHFLYSLPQFAGRRQWPGGHSRHEKAAQLSPRPPSPGAQRLYLLHHNQRFRPDAGLLGADSAARSLGHHCIYPRTSAQP